MHVVVKRASRRKGHIDAQYRGFDVLLRYGRPSGSLLKAVQVSSLRTQASRSIGQHADRGEPAGGGGGDGIRPSIFSLFLSRKTKSKAPDHNDSDCDPRGVQYLY